MSLEPWQRYRKATPCDICGGYGSYKPENRCKGFRGADGLGAYCSNITNGRSPKDFGGFSLYYHPTEDQEQGRGGGKAGLQRKSRYKCFLSNQQVRCKYHWYLYKGSLRHQAREREARRPPNVRDFG